MILTPIEKTLSKFLEDSIDKPVVWGISDCSSWAASWVETVTGSAPILPNYSSRKEAQAMIKAAGGLAPLWDDALTPIGIFETHELELGDVAVCNTKYFGQVGLIMAHGGIGYWRSETGVHTLSPRRVIKAWRVA